MDEPASTDLPDDRFFVECPNCGRTSGSYAPTMSFGSRGCRCGTTFKIDIDNEQAGEIVSE